jgi:hypothetical protein
LKKTVIIIVLLLTYRFVSAGPPFFTDDPEPVGFKHWEYYISSINTFSSSPSAASGTLPHFEVNYGVVPDVQLHIVLPLNYAYSSSRFNAYGYANTEFGVKYRFVKETEKVPEIGIFPIMEIPTVSNTDLYNGKLQVFLPVWVQKSWDKISSYGGGGYWINPGSGNKNWLFAGWQAQYEFSKKLSLGSEIYYHTAPAHDSSSSAGFNIGGFLNFSEKFHFIFSAGHSIIHENLTTAYAGLLWTI